MRKASLSKDHDEEPTTSGLNEEESREELINKTTQELIARTFSAVRNLRDKRELCLIRYFTNCMPEGSEEENLTKAAEANHKLNQIIEEQEQMRLHDLLESMLKNEKWNVSSLSELVPNLPPALLKDKIQTDEEKQTLQPIEINVDEPSTGIKEEPAHSVVSTGDGNVEKAAKMEAQVLQRVAELRRQGLWSQSQLPLCVDPPRNKTHWDYLLEEVKWMANDFKQERIFKRTMAKKLSAAISKQRKDQEMEVERAENRAIKDGRKICANIAKMIRDFWIGVDKMVDYKATKILENRKRRALDQHLSFIVGEADKLSNMVQEGLTQEKGGSKTPSISSKLDPDDKEFTMNEDEDDSDNESTLSKEEELEDDKDYKNELDALQNDADGGLDDLLANLPPEYLATMGISLPKRSTTNSPEDESTKDSEDSMKKEKEEEEDVQINDEGNGDGRGVLKDVDYAKLNSANADEREQELANIAEQASMFQPKGFTLETTQVKTQVPFLIRGNLREYQLVGLDWLVTLYEKNLNGILADEMGLGKTIQTISLLAHLACSESIWGPHLIVVPTSVILNWEMELKKWCPSFKILTYFGSVKERAEKRKGWSKPNAFHICITSYKTITTDIRSFKMKAWQYMILDEAQNIKNWKSQRWQALLNIRARRRLLLTGTPLQNSLMELWSLMHFLMPAIFASHDDFKDWFSNPLSGMMEGSVEYSAPLVARLHKILRPFILRRLKSEVEKQLPEKTESIIKCQLSKRQRYLYDDFMSRRSTKENLKTGNMFSVLNIVMQLRKCCNHPNLFEPRPVVSPFVLAPMKRTLPAMVFDIVGENARQEESEKSIPQCLKLKLTGWANGLSRGQPTIQEMKSYGSPILPPKLEGFRLSIPAISRPDSTAISPSVSLLDGISPAEAQRVGLNQNEQFLVIGEGQDERALTNGEVNNALKVRLQGEKFIVDKSSAPGLRPKICRVVVGHNGEKALIAVEKNPEPGHEPAVPEPSSASLPSSSSLSDKTVATQQWVQTVPPPGQIAATRSMSISSTRGQPTRRTITIHPSFKTHTQSYTRQLGVLTEVKGFNQVMANGGSRESIVDFDYKFSPPLKRRKIQETPVVVGQYSAYVPRDFQERLVGERIRRLEIAHARFALESEPIFPNHLISIFNKEMTKENSELLEMPNLDRQKEDNSTVLVNKFSLFVSSVQADAPVVAANTSGRSWMARQNENEVSLATRKCLKDAPPSVDAQLLASKIQFPELRLIEYDCGKLQTLAVLLRELYLYKHRCLIFTQMSRMLDILQAFLSHHGYQYFRLDGTTGIEQRQIMMERFNADPRIFCFILSTRSGGVGVNLTGADTVIFYDSDWNPTMDAQAQDRCHRIGQTRNVTIYRLISERTIEENILKKASQKKRLGEMAIDDAGFTPAWFKQTDSIRDLFDGDVTAADEIAEVPTDQKELESVMASLEDEQDVAASKLATAEAKADKAEFDEARRDTVARMPEDDIQDEEYLELVNQMKPVERYAIKFLEEEYKPDFDEEIKEAEAAIEQKKEDWVRSHQQAVLDDPLTEEDFYGCGSILDEVLAYETLFPDNMMSWCPPTPPLSPSQANDIYYDDCLDLLYDPDFMGESKLPSTLYDLHRPLQRTPSPIKKPAPPASPKNKNKTVMDLLNAATMSQYSSASVSPMSTYDSTYYPDYGYGPTDFSHANFDYQPAMKKEKRERTGKEREMALKLNRETPRPITPPTPIYEQEDYEGPEWSIVEDMWIVDAIHAEEAHGHMPSRLTYALLYNWDFVAQFVNSRNGPTGHFRSPRQCCIRYQMVVRPREAGHLHTMDPLTKKPRKVPVTQIELNHLKKGRSTTRAQFEHDFPQVMENQFTSKAKLLRDLMKKNKRPQKTYADVVPSVVQTQMPESFLQRLQELKIPITTILPEDMVRKQEEIHFNVFQENRAKAGEKVAEPEPLKAQSSISLRRSAIPSTGTVESKAPFMLELPASRPPPPPRPPAQTLHQSSSIPTLIASDHNMSTNVPRRIGSAGGSMSHMVSPSSSTHTNYVVVNSNDHSAAAATLRVQRAADTVGAANNAMFRPFNSAQVRRTPPTTPLTTGHPRPNYVAQPNQSNKTSYITGQQSGSNTTIYSGASPLSQGPRNVPAVVPRIVTRPGSRIYVNNERNAYVMAHPSTVRVVQGNTVQRVQPPKRVAPKPAGTTVPTMVVPLGSRLATAGPQLQQVRTMRTVPVQQAGGTAPRRVMVMEKPPGTIHHVVSQGGINRQQHYTSRMITSRTGSPQAPMAQVVLAPSNIQQQSSNQSQPQPPTSSQSGNVQQQASSLPPPLVAQTQLESQGAPPERSNSQSQ